MKKRFVYIALAAIALLVVAVIVINFALTTRLSGTFVSVDNESTYFVFEGKRGTFYEDGIQTRTGDYRASAKTSTGIFLLTLYENNDDLPTERYWLDGDKKTLSLFISEGTDTNIGAVAFTKKD